MRIRSLLLDHSPEGASLDVRTETLLMAADRAQHVAEVIVPMLASGRAVVTDRYTASSLAYQGYGRRQDIDEVRALSVWATHGLWPHCTVLLRVPLDVIVARMSGAGDPDRLESEGASFQRRVAEGFDELAAAEPDTWRVVDGVGTVDEVAARVWAAVAPFLPPA